jgi:integrase
VYRGGRRELRHFPIDTDPRTMQAWREGARARLRVRQDEAGGRAPAGSFEADARRYLQAVRALPTWTERRQHIEEWIAIFGRRRRDTIGPAEIRAARDAWLTTPRHATRRTPDGRAVDVTLPPYAASSVNHRLRALRNLWTVLDGRRAPNPVAEVPEAQEPADVPRALPRVLVEAILAAMPDRGRAKAGRRRPAVSLTKLRLRVMWTTGLAPRQIGQLVPADLAWLEEGLLRRPGRRKGRGTAGALVPIYPEAVAALRAFRDAGAFDPFSSGGMWRSFQRAVRALRRAGVDVPRVRPYDLRHSFITDVLTATGDLSAAQDLAGHEDARTTRRYVGAALVPVRREALRALAALRNGPG